MVLKASKLIDIRFSEVDSMKYFEDAREVFGEKYDLTYMGYFNHGYYAPLVEMNFQWKKPIKYGMHPRIDIIYQPTEAAKVVFDYEIHDTVDESLIATGHSVQVFMDMDYQLVLYCPKFYEDWQKRWNVFEKKEDV